MPAPGDRKAQCDKRAAEVKADDEARSSERSRAWQLTKKTLKG